MHAISMPQGQNAPIVVHLEKGMRWDESRFGEEECSPGYGRRDMPPVVCTRWFAPGGLPPAGCPRWICGPAGAPAGSTVGAALVAALQAGTSKCRHGSTLARRRQWQSIDSVGRVATRAAAPPCQRKRAANRPPFESSITRTCVNARRGRSSGLPRRRATWRRRPGAGSRRSGGRSRGWRSRAPCARSARRAGW